MSPTIYREPILSSPARRPFGRAWGSMYFCLATLVLALAAPAAAQTAVLVDGQPAVRCDTGRGSFITIRRELKDGKPQFRAHVLQMGSWSLPKGVLTVTQASVTFTGQAGESFTADRHDSTPERKPGGLNIRWPNGQSHYYLFVGDNWVKSRLTGEPCMNLAQDLGVDFAAGVTEFDRITASLNPSPPPAPKPTTATLQLTSDPGGAQVYVDGIFKGQTDDSGLLTVESTPGDHDLRLDHADYKEWKGKVTLTGEPTEQKIAMVKRGPEPLSVDEIDQALSSGMTPARCAELVKQYGVNFAVTPEIDKRLRDKGADSDLLLTIAENKR
jgi:PEGA domain-containing protein